MKEQTGRRAAAVNAIVKKAAALCLIVSFGLVSAAMLSSCGAKSDEATALRIRAEQVDGRATRTNGEQNTFELAAGDMLFGGDVAETEAESFAYLSFDAAKAAKLDESSAVEILEAGKKLEASLLRGNLFFDVKKPLEEGESFNIRVSNTLIGIRGTIGIVFEDGGVIILEGRVDLTDATAGADAGEPGSDRDAPISVVAGNYAVRSADGYELRKVKEEDVPKFAVDEIAKNEGLERRVAAATDLDIDVLLGREEAQTSETTEPAPDYITIKGEQYSTSLTELTLYREDLTNADIEPLRYMTNLTVLNLTNNQISDVSPLAGLTNLTDLRLSSNQISDVSPLVRLTNLTDLWLDSNQISDLSPLARLKNLTSLVLPYNNQISDVSPLAGLTNLTGLWLTRNQISDVSPLARLTNLRDLSLDNNQISDLSPLARLTNLANLWLTYNQISDVSPLAGLTNLTQLQMESNQISDLSPLAGLTNLTNLWLTNNQISDISPLAGLTNLTDLYLDDNQISDWSPVSHIENVSGRP